MTLKFFPATYEGNRIIRLKQDPEGFQQHQSVMVMVVPAPGKQTFEVQEVGLTGLKQFLTENERRFGMSSAKFFERFSHGEMGDDADYILWAGAYEIFKRMTSQN